MNKLGEEPPDLSPYPWVFQRDGEPTSGGGETVELIAVGDVMLGREIEHPEQALDEVAPWLREADVLLGNLEGVITTEEIAETPVNQDNVSQPLHLLAPPSAVDALAAAGFDILGLANNHALDLGAHGLGETMERLGEADIKTVGAGSGLESAVKALVYPVGGVRLAFLAFNVVPSPEEVETQSQSQDTSDGSDWVVANWDKETATAAVEAARTQADAVIVSLHWGYEYRTRIDAAQRAIADILFDAGADLVIGHHPHVIQGFDIPSAPALDGINSQGFVAYSLGNFVFDQLSTETQYGLALRVLIDGDGLVAVQLLPVLTGPKPVLVSPEQAGELVQRLMPGEQYVSYTCDQQSGAPTQAVHPWTSGIFRVGEVDLTGDGNSERVQLDWGRVTVTGEGVEPWGSPLEWEVLDLAIGDPNLDGRNELLLSFNKLDENGVYRSHPFIVGYRGGVYQPLWGGSAVSYPILEVELGDVDEDGVPELMVLEEQPGGLDTAVTVWDWHGWGFSLMWRSEPGAFRDLVFIPRRNGNPPVITVTMEKVQPSP
jgi:poly-gamma-glutamate synthesis protein (capsule biosynthesis protein)